MNHYWLNLTPQKDSGQYELHKSTCFYYPYMTNKFYVGVFSDCSLAMISAKLQKPEISNKIDGCAFCCSKCNKG